MAIVIRDATTPEFNDVAIMAVAAYREYADALSIDNWGIMHSNLLNMFNVIKPGQLIVAHKDQELIGSVIYCPPGTSDKNLFQSEWASLRRLAVSSRHRGQGIGRLLSLECIDRAKRDQAEVIGLHTSELMVAARKMYKRLGFQQEIELPSRLGITYWRYVLKLTDHH
jgi:ribosomal protein S18 acetylase RimI-like enzyme